MTPSDLRDEILAGGQAAGLAGPWAAGSDAAVAALPNAPTAHGYIPRRHLVVTLCRHPQVFGRRVIGLDVAASRSAP